MWFSVVFGILYGHVSFAAVYQWGPQSVKQPQMPQLPSAAIPLTSGTKPVVSIDKCRVDNVFRVPCGEPSIDAAHCAAINCCFDGHNCYYGNTVTVQCTVDGQFVLVVARDTTLPRLSLDSISLLGGSNGSCSAVDYTASFAIYQFPVTACGTIAVVLGDYVVYENKMSSSYEVGLGPLGAITRDSHFELNFQCRYSTTAVEALSVQLSSNDPPLPVVASGPLRVELRLGNGQCTVKGCPLEQVAYTSYYSDADYPVTKVLREPVFVEVRMLGRTDPNIALILGHCWATSSPDPFSHPQWDLLVDGCPYQGDRYLTMPIPVDGSPGLQFPSHYKRFVLKMFTFVDPASMAPLQQTVYIHCSTSVCQPTAAQSCVPSCTRQRRDVSAAERTSRVTVVVSSGEVCYVKPRSVPST
ncbi:zona pellucida sperm-binding protein 4-like [Hoplias malabaricus]|uniref:zona pellucida sperm-binding protein 4-like n=1 Tax=Hoplias malabaricus TaxID=27720 RepID=UPI003462B4A7